MAYIAKDADRIIAALEAWYYSGTDDYRGLPKRDAHEIEIARKTGKPHTVKYLDVAVEQLDLTNIDVSELLRVRL